MKTNLLRRIACLLTAVLLVNGSGFRSFAAEEAESIKPAVTADSTIDLADNDEIKATSVTVSPATLRLAPGEKRALTATILPLEASLNKIDASANSMDASLNRVTWKSTDESVAKVDASGNVLAIKKGVADIIATANDGSGKSGKCEVTVAENTQPKNDVSVNSIVVLPGSKELEKGESYTLIALVFPTDATKKTVEWTSSDPEVVTVDSFGRILAVETGTATVTATSIDGTEISDSCLVTVTDTAGAEKQKRLDSTPDEQGVLKKFCPETTDIKMIPGESKRLELNPYGTYFYGVKWEVTDASPAKCVKVVNGVVTASKAGTAVVKASYRSAPSVEFKITVDGTTPEVIGEKGAKLAISKKTVKLTYGKKATIKLRIPKKLKGMKIEASVMDASICSIEKNDSSHYSLFAKKSGGTYVVFKAVDESGKVVSQAYSKVLVPQPVTYINIPENDLRISPGSGKRIVPEFDKNNTVSKPLVFKSKGKGIKVTKSGYVLVTSAGASGYVDIKCGSVVKRVKVSAKSYPDKNIILKKTTANTKVPAAGKNAKKIKIQVKKIKNAETPSSITWGIIGDHEGIEVNNGVVEISSSARPGLYTVTASADGFSSGCCEIVVK